MSLQEFNWRQDIPDIGRVVLLVYGRSINASGVHGSPLRGENFGEVNSWRLLALETRGARGHWDRITAAVLLTRGGSTHRGVYWVTKFGNLSKLN